LLSGSGFGVLALLTGGCLPYTTATGVCMPAVNQTSGEPLIETNSGLALYTSTECDGVDSLVDLFILPDCSGDPINTTPGLASVDECAFFDTLALTDPIPLAAHVYRTLTSCMADSMELTNTSYCTAAPTMEPTSPTMMPTASPSMEPTAVPTMEPTTIIATESMDGDSAYALCLALSAIVSTMAFLF